MAGEPPLPPYPPAPPPQQQQQPSEISVTLTSDRSAPSPPPAAPPAEIEMRSPEEHLYEMADKYHVDPKLAFAILRAESGGRTNPDGTPLTSSAGAKGYFQLLPSTAYGQYKLDPTDPFQNIEAGVRYLREAMDKGDGSLASVAGYYHGGPNQKLWGPQTQAYMQQVEDDVRRQLAAEAPTQPTAAPTKAAAPPAATPTEPSWDPTKGMLGAPDKDWADPGHIAKVVASGPPPGPPPPPWYDRALSAVGDTASDLAAGGLKGAASTAINLGTLANRYVPGLAHATDALYGLPPGGSADLLAYAPSQMTVPSNTTQSIGKGAEQLLELLAPAGEVAKTGKLAEAALSPSLAPWLGESLAKLFPRMGVEAAGGAGMAAAQGGDPTTGAAVGAAVPVLGGLTSAIGERVGAGQVKKAGRLMQQAFGPTKERFKAAIQKRLPSIFERGLWGSRESILQRGVSALDSGDQMMDDLMAQYGHQPFTGNGRLIAALERAKDEFRTVSTATGRMVEIDPRPIRLLEDLQRRLRALGARPTIEQIRQVRQVWDKVVAQAGGFEHRAGGAIGVPLADSSEAAVKRTATGFIRTLLERDVPELGPVNREWSFWKGIVDTLRQTEQRTAPQKPGIGAAIRQGAGRVGFPLLGVTVGGHYGHSTAGAAIGASAEVLAEIGHAILQSPFYKTASAQVRYHIGQALQSGDARQLEEAVMLMLAERGYVGHPPPKPNPLEDIELDPAPPALPPPPPPFRGGASAAAR